MHYIDQSVVGGKLFTNPEGSHKRKSLTGKSFASKKKESQSACREEKNTSRRGLFAGKESGYISYFLGPDAEGSNKLKGKGVMTRSQSRNDVIGKFAKNKEKFETDSLVLPTINDWNIKRGKRSCRSWKYPTGLRSSQVHGLGILEQKGQAALEQQQGGQESGAISNSVNLDDQGSTKLKCKGKCTTPTSSQKPETFQEMMNRPPNDPFWKEMMNRSPNDPSWKAFLETKIDLSFLDSMLDEVSNTHASSSNVGPQQQGGQESDPFWNKFDFSFLDSMDDEISNTHASSSNVGPQQPSSESNTEDEAK
ncbi:uncharacterized protein LOC132286061 isoform X1 [Cornus florida]|uniref:uncharacterized protein LOC132286061 isoform X1 n=1 Tax=Cornus florida TaxID=4283 RepID=UPI0028A2A814|nr:uncharacterized protein LOC132286061 isoform X1 [Cornus florida]